MNKKAQSIELLCLFYVIIELVMNIDVICVGKLKEKYWTDAVAEYSKRLGRFCKLTITELAEVKLPDNAGPSEEAAVIKAESENIMKKLDGRGSGSYVVALDVLGKQKTSEELAGFISDLALDGKSTIYFIIGGSLGLSQELLGKVDHRLSFSKMTFPHQLMRVILLEQIYRAFKINNHEKYHK